MVMEGIKQAFKIIFIGSFLGLFLPGAVMAETTAEITADKLDIIQQNCAISQTILQQLVKSDAVTRINRGRSYDQLLHQISALNSRFSTNKVQVPNLTDRTSDIQNGINSFRSNYDKYSDDISSAVKVDCKNKPADFYQLVQKARGDRAAIGSDIDYINQQLDKYRMALVNYQADLQKSQPQG